MMEQNRKPNYFARIMIVVLSFLIAGVIIYSFLKSNQQLNSSHVSLIVILAFIVLSESFDNFSIGQLLTVSREKKEKDSELQRVSNENSELRSQFINIASSLNQNQTSTNIVGFPEGLIKAMMVGKASEEEIKEKEVEEKDVREKVEASRPIKKSYTSYNIQKMEEFAISRFLKSNNLTGVSVLRDAKLIPQFQGIDPVSDRQPVFDGYVNTGDVEYFIEVLRNTRHASVIRQDRYYFMLTKIFLYRSIKKTAAHLNLIVLNFPEDKKEINLNRPLQRFFEPAITNGLLKILEIDITKAEAKLLSRS